MTETNKKKNQSVVYSFEGRWEEPLRSGAIRVFFRKRRPLKFPNRVFLYVGVPVKAIIGFAEVESIVEVTLNQSKAIQTEGAITENELVRYIGDHGKVHAIRIGRPTIFPERFDLRELKEEYGFNPPQSFSIMNDNLERSILGEVE